MALVGIIAMVGIISVLAALLIPNVIPPTTDARLNGESVSTEGIRTALAEHYAQFASLPETNAVDLLLLAEGLLDKPFSCHIGTNSWVQAVPALPSGAIVTATNAAYDFSGGAVNQAHGSVVVEAIIQHVTAEDARELSLAMDGPELSSPVGEPDLKGRVKFGAIQSGAFGDIHVYITHH